MKERVDVRTLEVARYLEVKVTFYNSDDSVDIANDGHPCTEVAPWDIPELIQALTVAHRRWLEHWGPQECERVEASAREYEAKRAVPPPPGAKS